MLPAAADRLSAVVRERFVVPDLPNQLSPRANQVLFSVNPKAGRQCVDRHVEQIAQILKRAGFTASLFTSLDDVVREANRLNEEGRLRALVAVGGDGTVAELANRTAPGMPLTVYPAGTSNLLARQLGFSTRPETWGEMIAEGNLLQLDAGRASGRLFLLMIGCGFDAEVVRRVHEMRHRRLGGHLGYRSYIKPILQSIRSYGYPEIQVYCDQPCDGSVAEQAAPIRARWVFAFNFPRYGWGVPLAPGADCRDGLLELCTFDRGSLCHGLRYAAWAQMGWHRHLRDLRQRQVRRVHITSDGPVAYQLDGDPGGMLPVEVEVVPARLTLVVPPSARNGLYQ